MIVCTKILPPKDITLTTNSPQTVSLKASLLKKMAIVTSFKAKTSFVFPYGNAFKIRTHNSQNAEEQDTSLGQNNSYESITLTQVNA